MDRLDTEGGFDVHAHRDHLKLQRQDADTMTFGNPERVACPACDRPFERLFLTTDREVTFGSAPNGPICLVRTDDQLLVLTH